MLITKTIEIDMGHRVPNHKSKCRNLHGHRYKVEVGVNDKVVTTVGASDEGMVIDFSDLKEIMVNEIDARFDHGFMMFEKDNFAPVFKKFKEGKLIKDYTTALEPEQKITFVPFIPTAENIAKYWFGLLKTALGERKIALYHVLVYETPSSSALYTIEDYKRDNN